MKKSELKEIIKEEIKSLYELSGEEKLLSRFDFGPWPINDEGEADPGWAYDEDFIINFKDPDWALQKLEGIGFNEFDADIDIVLGSDGKGRLLFFGPTPRDMESVSNMFKEHDAHDYGWENTYPL